ncbi:TadE/TadG family type IV pilus assembly protein [Streptomyces sp. NPDC007910]|uniref:TadE/TadG family type IV pilus assembly protein n=1 Tax=Streptomyces sp. NPDC007910 TaxID=3364790 RepID=UPI0036E1D62B
MNVRRGFAGRRGCAPDHLDHLDHPDRSSGPASGPGPAPARPLRDRDRDRALGRDRDRGQAAIEYLGFLPVLLLVGLAGLQLGIAAYAAQQAGTAARAAARAASDDEDATSPEAAVDAAVSGWIARRANLSSGGAGGEATYTVTVEIPSVVPFWDGFGPVKKTATMPMPDEEDLP